ncbi:MAG: sigma-70 family RNA polymerase sigma factor [Nannocystaceae bacterium]|nr:sigma-70 family RNA polymerase sigma factor [Nannocystaceae bacterium]
MHTLTATTTELPSFAAIYREHAPVVRAAVRRLGVPSWSIEDAVQDVFVVAHRHLADFDGGSLDGWLLVIARRVAFRHRRSAWRQRRKLDALRQWLGLAPPERPWQAPEAQLLLRQMLARLAREQHQAFEVCEVQGHTAQEAAAQLGINPNTVATRLRAARLELRRALVEPPVPRAQVSRMAMARAYLVLWPRVRFDSISSTLQAAIGGGAWALGTAAVVATVIAWTQPRRETPQDRGDAITVVREADALPAAAAVAPPAPAELHVPTPPLVASPPVQRAATSPRAASRDEVAPLPPLDAELLAQAWRALDRGAVDEARRLVQTHRARHPDSPIADERRRLEDRLAQRQQ